MALDVLGLFTFFWAQVMGLQVMKLWLKVAEAGIALNTNTACTCLMFSACMAGLFTPESSTVLLCVTSLLVLGLTGSQSNHVFMKMILTVALLLSYRKQRDRWIDQACSAARTFLISLYLITALHKLNYDWLDIKSSCATLMHLGVAAMPPFQWMEDLPLHPIPTAAAAAELLLPLLLWLRYDRLATCIGSIFHLLICQMLPPMSVYPFSLLMAPIYIFIIPEQSKLFSKVRSWSWFLVPAAAVLAERWLPLMTGVSEAPFEYPPYGLYTFGIVWCWFVYMALLAAALVGPSTKSASVVGARTRVVSALVAAMVFGLGLMPYFGVRNYPALAMFSNLRTEAGRSNHFFLQDDLDILGWQRDYVTVHNTNIPQLRTAQVDLAPLFTNRTREVIARAGVMNEFWITPPPGHWTGTETRAFLPYSMPTLELRRRVSAAKASRFDGAFVQYTRTVAKPSLRMPWVWRSLGLDIQAEDKVVQLNRTHFLALDEDVDGLEEALPWWQAFVARFRVFDLEYSPCRH
mmetsp:Transcript_51347/g.94888  ORF Transcript_51347/g.94888 Transcript_51347/m.94888 type:complete len:519 (+) Transcript_51347:114-1670(+)